MLPTFPKIVQARRHANAQAIHVMVGQLSGVLAQIGRHVQFEGHSSAIHRADHSISPVHMRTASAEVSVPKMKLEDFTQQELHRLLLEVAEQFARDFSEHLFSVIGEATAATGNVVDGQGKPLSEDFILEAIDRMDHEFDAKGHWKPPTIVTGPGMAERFKALEETQDREKFEARLGKILEKKLSDFRRREADRILAG